MSLILPSDLIDDIIKYVGPTILPPGVSNKKTSPYYQKITNDTLVTFLIEHPEYVHINFGLNANSDAVRWLINRIEYVCNILQNTNPIAVRWSIKNIHTMMDYIGYFSLNENDIAVQWLIDNPEHIDFKNFSKNENDIAVRWLIKNPGHTYWNFGNNKNDIAVRWIIDINDKNSINYSSDGEYYLEEMASNPNNIASQWFADNMYEYGEYSFEFAYNENPIAAKYIIDQIESIPTHSDFTIRNLRLNKNVNVMNICANYYDIRDDAIESSPCRFNYSILTHSDEKSVDLILQLLEYKTFILSKCSMVPAFLSMNTNVRIVEYLHEHPEYIDDRRFAENPNCILYDDRIKQALLEM